MAALTGKRNDLEAWLLVAMVLAALGSLWGARSVGEVEAAEGTREDLARPPNILLLVADDLGYNDTDAINPGGAVTPTLRQLAQDGVTFTRHYADATCSPSRVALLTGRFPQRSGFRPTGMEIPQEFTTLPEALAGVGYHTALVGKWHAGEQRQQSLPLAQGFKEFFGFHNQWELMAPDGAGASRSPGYRDPWLRENSKSPARHRGHLTDILAQYSREFITRRAEQPAPWFLYHAFYAPHAPIQPDTRFAQRHDSSKEGRYLALLEQLDDAVGGLLQALDDTGQSENTLVIFVSDNGGTNRERDNNYPYFGAKDETYEGSFRTPLLMRWPGRIKPDTTVGEVAMNTDLYPTLLAAAGGTPVDVLDGVNLLPIVAGDAPSRDRVWEQYIWSAEAVSASYLSPDGRWRLAHRYGLPAQLYDLEREPTGSRDVAERYPEVVRDLRADLTAQHWDLAEVPVVVQGPDAAGGHTYHGFDLMRVPYQSTFTIALALNSSAVDGSATGGVERELAAQSGSWSVSMRESQLYWQLGDAELTAQLPAQLSASECTAVVLTGHLQPPPHLMPAAGGNHLKLYLDGKLVAMVKDFDYVLPNDRALAEPTHSRAGPLWFFNTAVNSREEAYFPEVAAEHRPLFQRLRREGELLGSSVETLSQRVCPR